MRLSKLILTLSSVLIAIVLSASWCHSQPQPHEISEAEALEFLEQRIPHLGKELRFMKERDPERFQMEIEGAKGRVHYYYELKERDPALAERLIEADVLEHESWQLADKINRNEEPERRDATLKELRGILNSIFNSRMAERKSELEHLEREIKFLRSTIQKREQAKDQIIKRHLEEMIHVHDDPLGWW